MRRGTEYGGGVHDLIIRGGTVVDGSGAARREADVAIDGDRIAAVGTVAGPGAGGDRRARTPRHARLRRHPHALRRAGDVGSDPRAVELARRDDARDRQLRRRLRAGATGSPRLADRPDGGRRGHPGRSRSRRACSGTGRASRSTSTRSRAGRTWSTSARRSRTAPLRAYVMGERGARNEPATPDDIATMARLVREALEAGALGFSTSRTQRASRGRRRAGARARSRREDELFAIGRALAAAGRGVFEVAQAGTGGRTAGDAPNAAEGELEWMRRLAAETQRPVSFLLFDNDPTATPWRRLLDLTDEAAAAGAPLVPQIANRPFGMLVGHQTRANPFADRPTYQAIASLPLDERVARLRDGEVRARILAERPARPAGARHAERALRAVDDARSSSRSAIRPTTSRSPERSVAAIAAREGRDPDAVLYDLMLGSRRPRAALLCRSSTTSAATSMPLYEMLHHPRTVLGLGDGGAHCGIVCDATMTTFTLTHWVRDRRRGPRLPLEFAVRRLTARQRGRSLGFDDRGLVRPGLQGRPQRDRPRPPAPAPSRGGVRPARRRPPPAAARRAATSRPSSRADRHARRNADRSPPGPRGPLGARRRLAHDAERHRGSGEVRLPGARRRRARRRAARSLGRATATPRIAMRRRPHCGSRICRRAAPR